MQIVRVVSFSIVLLLSLFVIPPQLLAQEQEYRVGTVREVSEERRIEQDGALWFQQSLLLEDAHGTKYQVQYGNEFQPIPAEQRLAVGDTLVITEQLSLLQEEELQSETVIVDRYRLPMLAWILGGFFLLILGVSGLRGIFSILGMFVSLTILVFEWW
jgi:uncharacterized membrane protein